MKRFICMLTATVLIVLCFAGCEENTYETRSTPSYSPPPTFSTPSIDYDAFSSFSFPSLAPESSQSPSSKEENRKGATVYVSRTGKIHRISNCSGMKYYTKMDYYEALDEGYVHCQNCY